MVVAQPIAISADPLPGGDAASRALIESQLAMLSELAAIGMEIARAAGRKASPLVESSDPAADRMDPALSYTRAARAVRLTLALQSKLMKDLAALDGARGRARAVQAARRRDRIHRRVEQVIEAERGDADDAEDLSADAWERLIDEDESALLDRPVEEVVARICQDLGLSCAWAVAATALDDAAAPGPARDAPKPPPQPSSSHLCRGSRPPPPPPRQDLEPDLRLAAGFPGRARE